VSTHQQAFSVGFKNILKDRSYECKSFSERYSSTSPVCNSEHAVPTAVVCSVRVHSYKVNWSLLYPNRKNVRHFNAQFSSFSNSFLLVVKQFLLQFLLKHPVKKLRWSRGSVLPLSTQVRGFKPGRSRQYFSGRKNPQRAFLRRGSKAVCPMS
jgi:hypothetical protein